MSVKLKIKKGDTVLVVAGRERGKSGKVTRVAPDHGHVFVERLNVVKRHQKARGPQGGGGILEKEAPLHISKVALWDPKANKGVRVGVRRSKDGKTRERISRATGEVVGG